MSPLRFQATGREGYEAVVTGSGELRFIREFGVLCLGDHGAYTAATGQGETLLHVVAGVCDVSTPAVSFSDLGGRATPFGGRPAAVYLPADTVYTVKAGAAGVEIAVTHAAASAPGAAVAIRPEAVSPKRVGRDNWQRTVTMIAPPESATGSLLAGETLNPPGNWSGVPAHKHDTPRQALESVHEELYYFRVDPAHGWGIERIYEPDGQGELLLLQDRVVTVMPRGYHTVAAAPGFRLFYSFVLSGPSRTLLPFIDPGQAALLAGDG